MKKFVFLTTFMILNTFAHKLCKENIIKDGQGFSWLNYCDENNNKILFYKDYSENWTFVTDLDNGSKKFGYRIEYFAQKCDEKGAEIDNFGNLWQSWCLANGNLIKFHTNKGNFIIDKETGEEQFGWRQVFYEKTGSLASFLQIHYTAECIELEGDNSGRFFPVDYSENYEKIEYEKDCFGNFLIDFETNERPLAFGKQKLVKTISLPLCQHDKIFEIDPSLLFFWAIEFKNSLPLIFVESDKFYFINPITGQRELKQ